jgi:hypothetical protein
LARWLSDERAETNWKKIKRKAPNLPPAEFIEAVLKARRSAVASVNRIVGVLGKLPGFNAEWREFLPALKKRITRKLGPAIAPIKAAEVLEVAAHEIRILHQSYFGFSDQVNFGLRRQGSNEDRSCNAFYEIMRDVLQEHCGTPLYEVIAFTAEIAFDIEEIDPDRVRYVLRQR